MNGKIYNVGGCLSEEFSTAEVRLILYLYVEKFPIYNSLNYAEPVFVNFLKSPVIDPQPVGPVRQPYTVKKRFASFPYPAGMSLPNSPWAGIMTS